MDCTPIRRLVWLTFAGLALSGCGLLPKARRFDDSDYQTKLGMAKLLEGQGQTERAGKIYRELSRLDPKDAEPPHLLALMEAKQGHNEQAGEYFKQALKLAPRDVELLNDYGYWLYLADRLEEAEKALATALEVNPEHKQVMNNLALVVGFRGRFQESLALFERCGSEADAHSNLAYVYARQRRFKEARRHYEKALELEPRMKAAAEALVQLNRRDADPTVQPAQAVQAPAPRPR
jgi:Flp pilus assembly protein TadD